MSDADYVIELACPSSSEHAAELIYQSNQKFFDFVFACPQRKVLALDFIKFSLSANQGFWAANRQFVIKQGDHVIAIGTCQPREIIVSLFVSTIKQIFTFYKLIQGTRCFIRMLWATRLMPIPKVNSFLITNIAVDSHYRRKGLATELVTYILNQYKNKQEFIMAELDVDVTNDAAAKVYQKMGFKAVKKRSINFIDKWFGLSSQIRMEKNL